MSGKFTEYTFPDEVENKEEDKKPEEEKASAEAEIEVIDDTPEKDRGRKPLEKEPTEPTEEELKEYSEKVQARIKELTHAKHDARRQKEAIERERDELANTTQALLRQQELLKKQLQERHTYGVTQAEKLAETELQQAKAEMAKAHEAGDTEAFVNANERMASAKLALERAKYEKNTPLRPQRESATVDNEQGERPPIQPKPDPKAARWREKNPWFGVDDEMTGYALVLHNKLVKSGYDTTSDEYYTAIDKRLRQVFPASFKDEQDVDVQQEPTPTKKPATVVAPVNRSTSAKKIRLTQTQVSLAKRLGMPLEVYAREVAKLEQNNG